MTEGVQPTWTVHRRPLAHGRGVEVAVEHAGAALSFAAALRGWRDDPGFRAFFLALLAEAPFAAYRWETPPVTAASSHRPFTFVLLDSPGLARPADADAFAAHFAAAAEGVVAFTNLGGDATLLVPCPAGPLSAYAHLAAFVRGAPEAQRHALWRQVGETVLARLSAAPLWLSTAGTGVPWLHVRLDDRPKYYGHEPYRR